MKCVFDAVAMIDNSHYCFRAGSLSPYRRTLLYVTLWKIDRIPAHLNQANIEQQNVVMLIVVSRNAYMVDSTMARFLLITFHAKSKLKRVFPVRFDLEHTRPGVFVVLCLIICSCRSLLSISIYVFVLKWRRHKSDCKPLTVCSHSQGRIHRLS